MLKNVNVLGHEYTVEMENGYVSLVSVSSGDIARDVFYENNEYAYTHGGRVFQAACELASGLS